MQSNHLNCFLCLSYRGVNKQGLCVRCAKKYVYSRTLDFFYKKSFGSSKRWKTQNALGKALKLLFPSKKVYEEVYFPWALAESGALLQYDFCIPEHKLLIELNGEQHYFFTPYFHRTKKEFKSQVNRDVLKAKLAKLNGWKLLVVSHLDCIDLVFLKNKILKIANEDC